MPFHTVIQGECISSIAEKHGFFWEKLWTHANNRDLKSKRQDPNVLFPGDKVYIPEKEEHQEKGSTGTKYSFRKKNSPAKLRLRILDFNEPLSNAKYSLKVDGASFQGTTDMEGILEHSIPPDAEKAIIKIGPDEDEIELSLGNLDPHDEIRGIQERLNNLSYPCPVDGVMGPKMEEALKLFQMDEGLTESGELGDATRDALIKKHDR